MMQHSNLKSSADDIAFTAKAVHTTHTYGKFQIYIAKNVHTAQEHVVLVKGDIHKQENVLCRLQSECLTGIALDSAECDCKEQLEQALAMIAQRNQGILIYLNQEGRGHGLTKKILALANKNKGMDTYSAVEALGEAPDIRDFSEAAAIIRKLQVVSIELLTCNPDKIAGMEQNGVRIAEIIPLTVTPTSLTRKHLLAKKARGFLLNL
ncbi:GTP cyclohydrolase II [Desulfococcaceae bacterium HSG9]|nr:GTP cyclohydrolase II [Desulfococcaceae bacterium HSG9]